ncbi:PrsW family glutamic-type intramembrane protease [Microbacterium sp. RD1]|uniref:PrsW family glutamic-type intramembrane protease n=1 Tax=Microbacterium sp. RD1 TaxID=3457313 RepID=UPI003FA559F0
MPSAVLASPDVGTYPTGWEGRSRAWDGAAWTGPALADESAAAAPDPHGGLFRRPPVYLAVGGLVVGFALAAVGGLLSFSPLLVLAGVVATGGPLAALLAGLHRRLGLASLPIRAATLWGLVSGVVAIGFALLLELPLRLWLDAPEEIQYLAAGPIEEVGKLLLPLILLAAGASQLRDPRLGVWAVAVSGAVFGAIEGGEYVGEIGPEAQQNVQRVEQSLSSLGHPRIVAMAVAVGSAIPRAWVELGHVIWTAGAAVLIWLAAHHGRRVVATAVGAIAAAAALHSFNDAGLTLLPGGLSDLGSIVWIVLSYTLWFRPLLRRLVPPDAVTLVPHRWLPRLPREAR